MSSTGITSESSPGNREESVASVSLSTEKDSEERRRSRSPERTRTRTRKRDKAETRDRYKSKDRRRRRRERGETRDRDRRRRRKRRSRSRSRSHDRTSSSRAASTVPCDETQPTTSDYHRKHRSQETDIPISSSAFRKADDRFDDIKESCATEPRWGKDEEYEAEEKLRKEREQVEKEEANFGLTGNLMEDEDTGAVVNGVKLKWSQPLDSRRPTRRWRMYVFKGSNQLDTLHIHRQASYLVGRDERVADISAQHPSISSQHAVIQFRLRESKDPRSGEIKREVKPYIMDLESTNGTMINKQKIEPARYTELRERDLINFGMSTRDYVLLHEHTKGWA